LWTRHEQIESQIHKQCESLDDESDLQLIPKGAWWILQEKRAQDFVFFG
jgi:hypothetical protein